MITLDQAKALKPGDIIYHAIARNADGTAQRWKVNGEVKTWKTLPGRVSVPVKHGLRGYDYVNEKNLHFICLSDPTKGGKAKKRKRYAYKVVRIEDELSCNMQFDINNFLVRRYQDGSILEAHPGTPGIFLFKRLEDCKRFVSTCSKFWKIKRVIPLAPLKRVKKSIMVGAETIASCHDNEDLKDVMTIFYKGPSATRYSDLIIQETPEGTYTCQKIQVVGDLVEREEKEFER